jgi:Na+-transporting NADH:ubiquinone oxidoreductase subunit C
MKNKYVFILTITIICSFFLSLAAEGLKDIYNKNVEVDKKKNILNAIGLDISEYSVVDIDKYFMDNIDTLIVDLEGLLIDDISISDLFEIENKQTGEIKYYYNDKEYLPLYSESVNNVIILPISGKGLWSSLFGYFAIDANNHSTVKGITFYAHGETPGLGAEISKEWFQGNFIGKEIYSANNSLQSVTVIKGKASIDNKYEVDGISGATITSNGVTTLLKRDLERYEPYFIRNRK